eukprot:jgi/Psemu1/255025/estExt_Genewise1Plus.C_1240028
MESDGSKERQQRQQQQQQQQQHNLSSSSSSVASSPSSSSSLVETQVFVPPPRMIGGIRYTPQSPAWHCCFSQNGEWLAACFGAPNPCIRVWRRERERETAAAAAAAAAAGNGDGGSTTPKWVFHSTLEFHERSIRSVEFCPLSSTCILAAASFDATVTIWELDAGSDTWECTTQLEGHENEVKCVAWNATGSLLATCGRDKTVWVWETFLEGSIGGSRDNEFECLAVLNGHEGDVKTIRFAPSHGIWGDGDELLLSASYDDTIKVWAEDDGDWYCAVSIADVHTDTIWSLAVAPGGGRLVSASADGSLAVLKCYTESERRERFPDEDNNDNGNNEHHHRHGYGSAGHGRIVSGGSDHRINVYKEIITSTSDRPLFAVDVSVDTTHGDVNRVCWHPRDGSILASAGDDGTVRIWKYDL